MSVKSRLPLPSKLSLRIDLGAQRLSVQTAGIVIEQYQISTAAKGVGEVENSECTPRGRHVIDEKIGAGAELNTVFVGRRATGEIYTAELGATAPGRDWILTRILWLRGLERGRNLGPGVDTKQRYIYIHGTPAETDMSVPGSRGCVRMRNEDVVELFDYVKVGTLVEICA